MVVTEQEFAMIMRAKEESDVPKKDNKTVSKTESILIMVKPAEYRTDTLQYHGRYGTV